MKITKLFLSIALVALTAISYGKISEPITECDCCSTEIVYEQELDMENWMAVPFESGFMESDLNLENWMIEPFESNVMESDLNLENWMVVPFEVGVEDEVLSLESWMAAAWK